MNRMSVVEDRSIKSQLIRLISMQSRIIGLVYKLEISGVEHEIVGVDLRSRTRLLGGDF